MKKNLTLIKTIVILTMLVSLGSCNKPDTDAENKGKTNSTQTEYSGEEIQLKAVGGTVKDGGESVNKESGIDFSK